MIERIPNCIGGAWNIPQAAATLPVLDPASARVLAEVPLSPAEEIARAADIAAQAFPAWRRTPAGERIHPLFKLKALLEANLDDLARTITEERGKTLAESISSFPFSESFFGDLHAQAHHSVEFYTQTKVVVERWPRDWSRKF